MRRGEREREHTKTFDMMRWMKSEKVFETRKSLFKSLLWSSGISDSDRMLISRVSGIPI
jgi:hypothetical protein